MSRPHDTDSQDPDPVFVAAPDDTPPVPVEASQPVEMPALVDDTPVEPVALPSIDDGVPDTALVVTVPPASTGPIVMTHPQVAVACTAVDEAQALHYEALGWTRDPTAANRVAIDAGGLRRPDPEPTEE